MGECRRVRQAKAQLIKAAFEIGAAAGAGMHGNPSRLVDDEDESVAVENALGEPPLAPSPP
jgi:hypothetical protein